MATACPDPRAPLRKKPQAAYLLVVIDDLSAEPEPEPERQ